MNNFKKYKILAFIALLAELIISFVLFGKIRNLLMESEFSTSGKSFYILIILSIFFVTSLFVIVIMLTYRNENEELTKGVNIIDESSNNNTNTNEVLQDELIDIESYSKRILPKEDSKLTLTKYSEKFLSNIAKEFDIVQGLLFVKEKESDIFNITAKYAYFGEEEPKSFKSGESLSGQVVKNKTILYLKDIPENYVTILSGLGSSSPNNLLLIPIIINNETIGLVELASFKEFKHKFNDLFEKISEQMGKALSKY